VGVIHDVLLLAALHPHVLPVVTAIVPLDPAAGIFSDVGLTVYVQVGAAPAWLTLIVVPAIVSVPLRDVVEVIA
jgi:hypothetical protein